MLLGSGTLLADALIVMSSINVLLLWFVIVHASMPAKFKLNNWYESVKSKTWV